MPKLGTCLVHRNVKVRSFCPICLADERSALALQVRVLNEYLDSFGDIAHGETPIERVQNVVGHYATQLGRWTGKEDKRKPCPACGQVDIGQYGEYPCPECGLPTVWDEPVSES